MKSLTEKLLDRQNLSQGDVIHAVGALLSAEIHEGEKAGFLSALHLKGETAEEIVAFVQALLAHAVDPQIDRTKIRGPLLDVCGTGGDRLHLFNVSTTSIFILAAGGAAIAKHGNRGFTSKSGGADVLEALGVRIDLTPEKFKRCLESTGLGFLFAPLYHPAFKAVAPIRKMLADQGKTTIFNLLGPLLNPVRPDYQLVGIYRAEFVAIYASALSMLGRKRAWALTCNGADEILPFGRTDVIEAAGSDTVHFTIDPKVLGIEACSIAELEGGSAQDNAVIIERILGGGDRGPRSDIALLNAAAGFVVAGLAADMQQGIEHAREQINSGAALDKLRELRSFSQAG